MSTPSHQILKLQFLHARIDPRFRQDAEAHGSRGWAQVLDMREGSQYSKTFHTENDKPKGLDPVFKSDDEKFAVTLAVPANMEKCRILVSLNNRRPDRGSPVCYGCATVDFDIDAAAPTSYNKIQLILPATEADAQSDITKCCQVLPDSWVSVQVRLQPPDNTNSNLQTMLAHGVDFDPQKWSSMSSPTCSAAAAAASGLAPSPGVSPHSTPVPSRSHSPASRTAQQQQVPIVYENQQQQQQQLFFDASQNPPPTSFANSTNSLMMMMPQQQQQQQMLQYYSPSQQPGATYPPQQQQQMSPFAGPTTCYDPLSFPSVQQQQFQHEQLFRENASLRAQLALQQSRVSIHEWRHDFLTQDHIQNHHSPPVFFLNGTNRQPYNLSNTFELASLRQTIEEMKHELQVTHQKLSDREHGYALHEEQMILQLSHMQYKHNELEASLKSANEDLQQFESKAVNLDQVYFDRHKKIEEKYSAEFSATRQELHLRGMELISANQQNEKLQRESRDLQLQLQQTNTMSEKYRVDFEAYKLEAQKLLEQSAPQIDALYKQLKSKEEEIERVKTSVKKLEQTVIEERSKNAKTEEKLTLVEIQLKEARAAVFTTTSVPTSKISSSAPQNTDKEQLFAVAQTKILELESTIKSLEEELEGQTHLLEVGQTDAAQVEQLTRDKIHLEQSRQLLLAKLENLEEKYAASAAAEAARYSTAKFQVSQLQNVLGSVSIERDNLKKQNNDLAHQDAMMKLRLGDVERKLGHLLYLNEVTRRREEHRKSQELVKSTENSAFAVPPDFDPKCFDEGVTSILKKYYLWNAARALKSGKISTCTQIRSCGNHENAFVDSLNLFNADHATVAELKSVYILVSSLEPLLRSELLKSNLDPQLFVKVDLVSTDQILGMTATAVFERLNPPPTIGVSLSDIHQLYVKLSGVQSDLLACLHFTKVHSDSRVSILESYGLRSVADVMSNFDNLDHIFATAVFSPSSSRSQHRRFDHKLKDKLREALTGVSWPPIKEGIDRTLVNKDAITGIDLRFDEQTLKRIDKVSRALGFWAMNTAMTIINTPTELLAHRSGMTVEEAGALKGKMPYKFIEFRSY